MKTTDPKFIIKTNDLGKYFDLKENTNNYELKAVVAWFEIDIEDNSTIESILEKVKPHITIDLYNNDHTELAIFQTDETYVVKISASIEKKNIDSGEVKLELEK